MSGQLNRYSGGWLIIKFKYIGKDYWLVILMKIGKFMVLFIVLAVLFAVACSQPAPAPSTAPNQAPKKVEAAKPAPAPKVEEKPAASPAPVQAQAPAAKTVTVSIKGFKFSPADITINIGDTIVWTNDDSAPHTVESSDGTLKSDELTNGDTYSHTFAKAGKVSYMCGIHPSMKGSVTVQ